MSAVIKINDVALAPIEHHGVRVMTLAMMDAVHKRPDQINWYESVVDAIVRGIAPQHPLFGNE